MTFAKSPTLQFPELRGFKHFLPGGQPGRSLEGGDILGSRTEKWLERSPRHFYHTAGQKEAQRQHGVQEGM